MKQLLVVLVALWLPSVGNALTYSYYYLGADGTKPYTDWQGTTRRHQTGVMHVDTTVFGMPHGRSYQHYNSSENNYGQDADTGIYVSFAFGLYADAFSVTFDQNGNVGTWSASNVWEGPSWFADFYDASPTGEQWVQLNGPYYSETLYEAGAGNWFSSLSAYQKALAERNSAPSPVPEPGALPVPLPAAAWLMAGGLLGLGGLGLGRRTAKMRTAAGRS